MNCANHPHRECVAYCQHCGKPLCPDCVRNVGTSVFCEPCLTAKVAGTPPPTGNPFSGPGNPFSRAGFPPAGTPPVPGEPNPGLAALLGFIPGVGAMYNEQYAKGLVHLLIFAVLVSLSHEVGIFHLFVLGWVLYMVIDAYHTARARRDGTPLPNPFGLNDLSERFGYGNSWPGGASAPPRYGTPPNPDPSSQPAADPAACAGSNIPPANPNTPYGYAPYAYTSIPPIPPTPPVPPVPPCPDPNPPSYRRFPSGAIWLIALGLFFLLGNSFHILRGRFFGPTLLIGFGVWLFVHMMLNTGCDAENTGQLSRWRLARAVHSSFWIILTGVIWLLDVLGILPWSRSWPIYLIAAGVMLLVNRSFYSGYTPSPGATAAQPPVPPVASTEIAPNGPWNDRPGGSQEGR
jgi:TM2 domain-containing membrane protein YozV